MMSAIYQKHKDKETAQKYYICHCDSYDRRIGFCSSRCPRIRLVCECSTCLDAECITIDEDGNDLHR